MRNSIAGISFIGGGNMASALIGGLVGAGLDPQRIHVAEPVEALRDLLAQRWGVQVHATAEAAAASSAVWVLAVKPQVLPDVCRGLAPLAADTAPLVVSIAAGITCAQLDRWLGGDMAIVRTMPNTPALLGAGVTGLHANARVDDARRAQAQQVLEAAGRTVWIEDEVHMDAVTGVSGSGPAYVFLLAEAMEAAALRQGLAPDAARLLVTQTLLGAARMLDEAGEAPAELRRRVTSPNGTTQAAIETFQAGGFEVLVDAAVEAATRRGAELSAANDKA